MRTLICEGIRAFILVEGWPLPWRKSLFLIGILLNSPKRDRQNISL